LKNAGLGGEDLLEVTKKLAAQQCDPPLDEDEIRNMVAWGDGKSSRALDAVDKAAQRPIIQTLSDIVEKDLPEVQYIVPGLIAEGLMILAGAPKIGKSWFALNLVLQVAKGEPVFGAFDTIPGQTLYLALEDTERRIKSRTEIMGLQASEDVEIAFNWQPSDGDGLMHLETWLASKKDPKLIVIDPFTLFRGSGKPWQNAYHEDYSILKPIQELALKYRVAIIAIYHFSKQEQKDELSMINGSMGTTACADSTAVIQKSRGVFKADLFITGRDIIEQRLKIKMDPTTCIWVCEKEKVASHPILQLLRDADDGMKSGDITEALNGMNHNTVRSKLSRLKRKGLIIEHDRVYWPATPQ
jgi:DNA-binding transcriptional ArsR family regulator